MTTHENKMDNRDANEKRARKTVEKAAAVGAFGGTGCILKGVMESTGLAGGAAFTKAMSMLGGPAGMVGGAMVLLGIYEVTREVLCYGADKLVDDMLEGTMSTAAMNNYLINAEFTI